MSVWLPALLKPEYILQPRQFARRILGAHPSTGRVRARIPGGFEIDLQADDDLGRAVLRLGVFDLVVTESIMRLTDPGETVVDAGANIGYMTAVFAASVGSSGTVYAFEPHPQICRELQANAKLIQTRCPGIRLVPVEAALSDVPGTVRFRSFEALARNRGTSAVVTVGGDTRDTLMSVPAARLDDALSDARIGVLKVDVEGHERALFLGGTDLLSRRAVRDIIFEEHGMYPTPVTRYLEDSGLVLFRLHRKFTGPVLLPPDSQARRSHWEATSFLATQEPDRARARMAARGWRCLKPSKLAGNDSRAQVGDSAAPGVYSSGDEQSRREIRP